MGETDSEGYEVPIQEVIIIQEKAKKDYSSWTKEELIEEVKKLKKRKKYGIVWEDKPELVAELCKGTLPILTEDKSREITTNKAKPTNILIEGDNYHALSVLNYTHRGKIDVIYIDPPYNTGNKDFTYNDRLVDVEDSYRHSKWLSFMKKRLKLAKSLLKRRGVIFISIDDNEVAQLKLLCDEVLGEKNLVQMLVWHSKYTVSNDAKFFSKQHEYILCYAKEISEIHINLLPRTVEANERYSNQDHDKRGAWKPTPLHAKSGTEKNKYEFKFKNGVRWFPPQGRFPRFSKDTLKELEEDNRIWFSKNGQGTPSVKTFLSEVSQGIKSGSLLPHSIFGHTHKANEQLADVLEKGKFDNPKPIELISGLIKLSEIYNETVVLDFFAGSGTTGHAVLKLNNEDGGNRQFILCTNNENDICTEVCYPRVQKVIEGYKDANGRQVVGLGGNLKYFKTGFVEGKLTNKNKKALVDKSTEMLCLKEDCFEEVSHGTDFKIFKNHEGKHLGIVYDDEGIEPIKKEIKKINKKLVVYVFSLDESAREEEFEEIDSLADLKPIPNAIMNIYKRLFK